MLDFNAVDATLAMARNGVNVTPEIVAEVKSAFESYSDPVYEVESFFYNELGREDYAKLTHDIFVEHGFQYNLADRL